MISFSMERRAISRRPLEGADVAAFAADDAALHLVAREVDHRDHRVGGVGGGEPLDRHRDHAARLAFGVVLGDGEALLDEVRLLLLELRLELVEEQLHGVFLRQARDPVQGRLLLLDDLGHLAFFGRDLRFLAVDVLGTRVDGLLAALELVGALFDPVFLLREAVFRLAQLVALLADLLFGVIPDLGGVRARLGDGFLGGGGGFRRDPGGLDRGLALLGLGDDEVGDGESHAQAHNSRNGGFDHYGRPRFSYGRTAGGWEGQRRGDDRDSREAGKRNY
jgi:hypothetical protein